MAKIRKGKRADIDVCINIAKTPELAYMNRASKEDAIKYLVPYITKGIFLVAEEKEKVVGYISGEYMLGDFVWLDSLVVMQEYRGKGIGKQLLLSFKEYVKKKNIEHIYLVAPKFNQNTIAFYEKMGLKKGNEYYEFSLKL